MGRLERGDTGHRTYVGPAASIRRRLSRRVRAREQQVDKLFREIIEIADDASGVYVTTSDGKRTASRRCSCIRPDGAIAKQTSDAHLNASAQPPTRTTQWMLTLQRAANRGPEASSACLVPAGLWR